MKNRRGMSMVEVLISMGLLTVVALGLFQFFASSSKNQSETRLIAARDEIVRRIRAASGSVGPLQTSALIPASMGSGTSTTRTDGASLNHGLRDCLDLSGNGTEAALGANGCPMPQLILDGTVTDPNSAWTTSMTAASLGAWAGAPQVFDTDVILFAPSAAFPGGAGSADIPTLLQQAVSGPWSGIMRPVPTAAPGEIYEDTRASPPYPNAVWTVRYDQNGNRCFPTVAPGATDESCPLMAGTRFRTKCRGVGGPGFVSNNTDQTCPYKMDIVQIDYWVGLRHDFPGGQLRIAPAQGQIVVNINPAQIQTTTSSSSTGPTTSSSSSSTSSSTSSSNTSSSSSSSITTSSSTSSSSSTSGPGTTTTTDPVICTPPFATC